MQKLSGNALKSPYHVLALVSRKLVLFLVFLDHPNQDNRRDRIIMFDKENFNFLPCLKLNKF